MDYYDLALSRLSGKHRSRLHSQVTQDVLREYCRAKPGTYENVGIDNLTFTYKVLEGSLYDFAELEVYTDPIRIFIRVEDDKALKISNNYPSIQAHLNKYREHTLIEIPLDDTLNPEALLNLIDHAYSLQLDSLHEHERGQIELMDGKEIDDHKIQKLVKLAKLTGRREEILKLLMPSIRIRVHKIRLPLGFPATTSHFGGLPGLPDSIEWPVFDGQALSFIGQINLQEIPDGIPGKDDLPESGMLYFFSAHGWGEENFPWEFEKDPRLSRTIYFDGNLAKIRREAYPPAPIPVKPVTHKGVRFEFLPQLTLPTEEFVLEDHRFDTWSKDEKSRLMSELCYWLKELYDGYYDYSADHRLLGHPMIIQGPLLRMGERLLLQVGTDRSVDHFRWGDGGYLYFIINEDDLSKANFGNVRVIEQSG